MKTSLIFLVSILVCLTSCISKKSITQLPNDQYKIRVVADWGKGGSADKKIVELARSKCESYKIIYQEKSMNYNSLQWEYDWIIQCTP